MPKLSADARRNILVLLTLGCIGGLAGWWLYDLKVRQPRFAEMRELYQTWKKASANADSARATIEGFRDEKADKHSPEELASLERRYNEARAALAKYQKVAQSCDNMSQGQYGVLAADLPRLLP